MKGQILCFIALASLSVVLVTITVPDKVNDICCTG